MVIAVKLKTNIRNYLKKYDNATVGELSTLFQKDKSIVVLTLDELIEEGTVDYKFDKKTPQDQRTVENRLYFYID